jgi:hypothetical protein
MSIGRNEICFCGNGKKTKHCHVEMHPESRLANLVRLYLKIDNAIDNAYRDNNFKPLCSKGCEGNCCSQVFSISDTEFSLILYYLTNNFPCDDIGSFVSKAKEIFEFLKEVDPDYIDLITTITPDQDLSKSFLKE